MHHSYPINKQHEEEVSLPDGYTTVTFSCQTEKSDVPERVTRVIKFCDSNITDQNKGQFSPRAIFPTVEKGSSNSIVSY